MVLLAINVIPLITLIGVFLVIIGLFVWLAFRQAKNEKCEFTQEPHDYSNWIHLTDNQMYRKCKNCGHEQVTYFKPPIDE